MTSMCKYHTIRRAGGDWSENMGSFQKIRSFFGDRNWEDRLLLPSFYLIFHMNDNIKYSKAPT